MLIAEEVRPFEMHLKKAPTGPLVLARARCKSTHALTHHFCAGSCAVQVHANARRVQEHDEINFEQETKKTKLPSATTQAWWRQEPKTHLPRPSKGQRSPAATSSGFKSAMRREQRYI